MLQIDKKQSNVLSESKHEFVSMPRRHFHKRLASKERERFIAFG
jgi:hypothetical protein